MRVFLYAVVAGTVALAFIPSPKNEKAMQVTTESNTAIALTNPVGVEPNSIRKGRGIFEKNCSVCHGAEGHGNGPQAALFTPRPIDLVSPNLQSQSDSALFSRISTGKASMPSFGSVLSETNRWHLVNYLRDMAAHANRR